MAEREVLDNEIGARSEERSEPTQDRRNSLEHPKRMDAGGTAVNGAPGPPIALSLADKKSFAFKADGVSARDNE